MTKSIDVAGLSKRFYVQENRRLSFFRGLMAMPEYFRKKREIWALRNITFTLDEGDCLGVVGVNGSGKSTLLRVLEGVYRPTSGSVRLRHDTALLQIGLGFNPELTVAENVYLGGAVQGVSLRRIEESFKDIIAFAELEEYVDVKMKVLSTGMFQRLAFSTTIQTESDILLLDEMFAVGDERFIHKCKGVMDEFRSQGRTIIMSSHSRERIRDFCDKVLVIHQGQQMAFGPINESLPCYDSIIKGSQDCLRGPN